MVLSLVVGFSPDQTLWQLIGTVLICLPARLHYHHHGVHRARIPEAVGEKLLDCPFKLAVFSRQRLGLRVRLVGTTQVDSLPYLNQNMRKIYMYEAQMD